MYRQHLGNVYHALGVPPPEELSRPILKSDIPNLNQPPAHAIHPVIDGEVTSYFEWVGAGRYHPDNRSGAMHSEEPKIRDVYYGADNENLYLRLDLDDGFQLHQLDLSADQKTVPLLNNAAVQFARKRIAEVRVPLAMLGISTGGPIHFQLGIGHEIVDLAIPA